jgi:hypothetical protein
MMAEQDDGKAPDPALSLGEKEPALGEPIRVFRAKLMTRVIVAVCGIVLVAGGVVCLILGFTAGVVTLPVFLGICVLGLAYLMGQQSCLVFADGVVNVRLGQRQWCRWVDISEIVDTRTTQGVVSSRVCTLRKKDGSRLEVRDLGIDDFGALLALFREQAAARGISWREERVAK